MREMALHERHAQLGHSGFGCTIESRFELCGIASHAEPAQARCGARQTLGKRNARLLIAQKAVFSTETSNGSISARCQCILQRARDLSLGALVHLCDDSTRRLRW